MMLQYLVICQKNAPNAGALYTPEQDLKTDRRDVVEYLETLRQEDMRPAFVFGFRGDDFRIYSDAIPADEFEAEYWADAEDEKRHGPQGDVLGAPWQ